MSMVGAMQQSGDASQFHFTPEHYLELMHAEVPRYDELQNETARATQGRHVRTILELGVGTGETSRRVLARHPGAKLTGIDASAEMLADLFDRIAAALADGGTFVLADVIVPNDPADVVTPCTPGFDLPDRLDDQLNWLAAAGFDVEATWVRGDLAVMRANLVRT